MRKSLAPVLRAVVGLWVAVGIALSPSAASAAPESRRNVPVLVPERENLQALAFWVAVGAGFFEREGLNVEVVPAPAPSALQSAFKGGAAPVAVLPDNDYERLVSDRFPFVLVANLLQNDPNVLVLRRDLVERLYKAGGRTVRQRLDSLRGVPIAMASRDRPRFYELFYAEGLDANLAQIKIRKTEELDGALVSGDVDGVYASTPVIDRLMVGQDAVVFVDPAGGEVPAFAERAVQVLAVTSEFASAHKAEVEGLVRAIARAEHLVRFDAAAAADALVHALPAVSAKRAKRIVDVFGRAVPATPHIEGALIKKEEKFYPVGGDPLKLDGLDLDDYVLSISTDDLTFPGGGGKPRKGQSVSPRNVLAGLGLLVLAIALLVVIIDQRQERAGEGAA